MKKKTDDNLKKEWLNKAISDLSIRERFIIRERKLNYKAKTLDEIGKELRVSKERVRQIEVAALKKLQYKITNISNQSKDFFIN